MKATELKNKIIEGWASTKDMPEKLFKQLQVQINQHFKEYENQKN